MIRPLAVATGSGNGALVFGDARVFSRRLGFLGSMSAGMGAFDLREVAFARIWRFIVAEGRRCPAEDDLDSKRVAAEALAVSRLAREMVRTGSRVSLSGLMSPEDDHAVLRRAVSEGLSSGDPGFSEAARTVALAMGWSGLETGPSHSPSRPSTTAQSLPPGTDPKAADELPADGGRVPTHAELSAVRSAFMSQIGPFGKVMMDQVLRRGGLRTPWDLVEKLAMELEGPSRDAFLGECAKVPGLRS